MDFPPYPSGLRLAGRRVVVVGGGTVAQRRVPQLIAVGADVHVVSPDVTPAIEGLVGSGEITWHQRRFEDDDLEAPGTSSPSPMTLRSTSDVSELAEQQRIFCVRSDDATRGSAWTPAVGRHAGVTVAVLGNREPRRSVALRDEILEALREGRIAAPAPPRQDAGRHPRRRRTGRPGADVDRRPQGADGGRRGGRRPTGAA